MKTLQISEFDARNIILNQIQRDFSNEPDVVFNAPARRTNLDPLCINVHFETDQSYRIIIFKLKHSLGTADAREDLKIELEVKAVIRHISDAHVSRTWRAIATYSFGKMSPLRPQALGCSSSYRLSKSIELAMGSPAINFILDLQEESLGEQHVI